MTRARWIALVLLLGYLLVLARLTLTSSGPAVPGMEPAGNLVPFRSILATLTSPTQPPVHQAVYLLGNAVLMTPLALVTTLWTSRVAARLTATCALALSATIELIQPTALHGRAGDIDDVLLNTAGALIAALALRHSGGHLRTRKPRQPPPCGADRPSVSQATEDERSVHGPSS